jgi:hypothetical protein
MLGHRVAQRSYPQGKSAAMKWVIIIEIWYKWRFTGSFGKVGWSSRSSLSATMCAASWRSGVGHVNPEHLDRYLVGQSI